MNAWHPSIDQIADYEAGLTAASDTGQVAEHLATCAECRDTAARVGEVSHRLAAAAAAPAAMPDDVAARLDAALTSASRERAAGIPSLVGRRNDGDAQDPAITTRPTGRATRRSRWVLGTAAAVAVFAIGGAVFSNGLPELSSKSSDDSSAGSADSALNGGGGGRAEADSPTTGTGNTARAPGADRAAPPHLDKDNVSTYAERLAGDTPALIPTTRASKQALARCGYPTAPANASGSTEQAQAFVLFDGDPALLRVARADRRLTVLSCPGPARILYRSSY